MDSSKQEKSLSLNAALNVIKTIASILFPLITLPYVNRILQVENMGKINFATTFVNYYIQLAGLGIANYAIREGARIRDDKKTFNEFCNQIFSINVVSTIFSYIVLALTLFIFPGLSSYTSLILILCINIAGTTIGISWLYSITEDYAYITVRSLLFQVIALILMFLMIRNQQDTWKYAVILVVSSSGAGILNYIHSKKYINIGFTKKMECRKHLPPILVLFSASIAMIIYVNSDSTMISLMCGDYYNGLYSVSVKIYTILKNILAAIFVVTLPRLSYYISNGMTSKYSLLIKKSLSFVFLFIFPIIVGLNMICNDLIKIVAGDNFMGATASLRILSFAIFFSLIATYFTNSILLPYRREKIVLIATSISATMNVLLNLIMIPILQERGAALTTLVAEITVVLIELPFVLKHISINVKSMVQCMVACLGIIVSCDLSSTFIEIFWIKVVFEIVTSSVSYFTILLIMKNTEIMDSIIIVRRKLRLNSNQ